MSKSALSIRFEGIAPQSTITNGIVGSVTILMDELGDKFFTVPLSPKTRTVSSLTGGASNLVIDLLHCRTLTDHSPLSLNVNGGCGDLNVLGLGAGICSARHEVEQLPLIDRFREVSVGALFCGVNAVCVVPCAVIIIIERCYCNSECPR